MLTLYYCPGACSTASHIGLEESGAEYQAQMISLAKGEQRAPGYLKINPRGRVPALKLEDGSVLVENAGILAYLAWRFPDKALLPEQPLAAARAISMMAWFSNTVHPASTHINRPERFTEDESAFAGLKEMGRKSLWSALAEIDGLVTGRTWMQGDQFTVCDLYALVFYGWGARLEMPVKELVHYTAWKDRMLRRPAVRKVLEREQNILLHAA